MTDNGETEVLFLDCWGESTITVTDGQVTATLGALMDLQRIYWSLPSSCDYLPDCDTHWLSMVEDVIEGSGLLDVEVETDWSVADIAAIKRVLAAVQAKREERLAAEEAARERKRLKARERYLAKKAATCIAA